MICHYTKDEVEDFSKRSKVPSAAKAVAIGVLYELLDRHAQSRAKISSQCDTIISKKLVEDMIKELE